MKKLLILAVASAIVATAVPTSAGVLTYDHLRCFKIKDTFGSSDNRFNATVTLTHQLSGYAVATGCAIKKIKSKEYCTPVDKSVTTDAPGQGDYPIFSSLPLSDFICYKVKCDKAVIPAFAVVDQFGPREISKSKSAKLCAPAHRTCGGSADLDFTDGLCPFNDPCVAGVCN